MCELGKAVKGAGAIMNLQIVRRGVQDTISMIVIHLFILDILSFVYLSMVAWQLSLQIISTGSRVLPEYCNSVTSALCIHAISLLHKKPSRKQHTEVQIRVSHSFSTFSDGPVL